jgi:SagB-type dehydrogenase family enzyme
MPAKNSNDSYIGVNEYHKQTKHSLEKYAAGPGTLDWSMQPNAFRSYDGCRHLELPVNADKLATSYAALYVEEKITSQEISLANIGSLFELSLGLSSWKQYGPDKWALRCNPSSGNLHPTEGYLINWDNTILDSGIYHYRSDMHLLEQRCDISAEQRKLLSAQTQQQTGFLIGLSSIHWREAWKYGERAYRYCQLDVGHAIAAISYAAATLGWSVMHLDNFSDKEIESLLGLNHKESFKNAETEHPDAILYISNTHIEVESVITSLAKQLCDVIDETKWKGQANTLDHHHMHQWPIIDQVAVTTRKPETFKLTTPYPADITPILENEEHKSIQASNLIRQRRSAQVFDNSCKLDLKTFYYILDKLLARNITPWNSINLPVHTHLIFYIHRVEGLKPGLYALPRHVHAKTMLQSNMRTEFKWLEVDDCPQHIPLYELVTANSQNAARKLSCHQDIAADSAFCVSMLTEYKTALQQGDWHYRYLHWEAGVLGHVMYLEAEAANSRGTGIGCFFDDSVHQILGIESDELQVVYHFTVGTPIVDQRIISLPPYRHLKR